MATKINREMTPLEVIQSITGGNPEAMGICMEIVLEGADIDPNAAFGGLQHMHMLDACSIYNERICMFCKDVCADNVGKMIAVLRALQLGLAGVTEKVLDHAIDNRGDGIDIDAVVAAVKTHLPQFNPFAATA